MLFKSDISNREAICAQSNEDLLQDYVYTCEEVSNLDFMTDYAEYVHENYWREIKEAIKNELLQRMGEFNE